MNRLGLGSVVLIGLVAGGCGTAISRDYPNSLVGADGNVIRLDDVQRINDNPNLDEEGRRQEIQALGIDDEKLVDALLEL